MKAIAKIALLLIVLLIGLSGCAGVTNVKQASDAELLRGLMGYSFNFKEMRDELRLRHPEWDWATIDKRVVHVGMSALEAALSWGKPYRINKSHYGGNTYSEQWVYERGIHPYHSYQYIYIDHTNTVSGWN